MISRHARSAFNVIFGVLLSGTVLVTPSFAQSNPPSPPASNGPTSPWDREVNTAATQSDAWFDNYKFRDGETLERLKIHYATLGTPHRNATGDIDNAVLVLHWTGAAPSQSGSIAIGEDQVMASLQCGISAPLTAALGHFQPRQPRLARG
jgi:homoserine O-acetyltransferase/O-succinyltransferase